MRHRIFIQGRLGLVMNIIFFNKAIPSDCDYLYTMTFSILRPSLCIVTISVLVMTSFFYWHERLAMKCSGACPTDGPTKWNTILNRYSCLECLDCVLHIHFIHVSQISRWPAEIPLQNGRIKNERPSISRHWKRKPEPQRRLLIRIHRSDKLHR